MSHLQQENNQPPSYEESDVQHSFVINQHAQDLQPLIPNYESYPPNLSQTCGQVGNPQAYPNQYNPPPGGYPNPMYQPAPISHQYTSTTVVATQPQSQQIIITAPVRDNAFLAWFSCLCCFWPVGLCAVISSCEVNSALAANDIERAQRLSGVTRRYALTSIGIGIGVTVGGIVLILVLVFMAGATGNSTPGN